MGGAGTLARRGEGAKEARGREPRFPCTRGRATEPPAMKRRERNGFEPKIHPPSVVAEGATLGSDVMVGAFCFVAKGAVVGAGTRIQSHTSVWAGGELGIFWGGQARCSPPAPPRAGLSPAPPPGTALSSRTARASARGPCW